MLNKDNRLKSIKGWDAKGNLSYILDYCYRTGYLNKVVKDYSLGKPGFKDSKQFKATFMIEFNDLERWILFSTTSCRSDRLKGKQWDSFNLKQLDNSIIKSFVIYPDEITINELKEFKKTNEKIQAKYQYSSIEAFYSYEELLQRIEEKGLQELNPGQKRDYLGRTFEDRVAMILNYHPNLIKYFNPKTHYHGLFFNMFSQLLDGLGLNNRRVKTIEATTDKEIIGKLPSGGNPKTDVYVRVIYEDNNSEEFSLSCKLTTSKKVTVHDYDFQSFVDVLDPTNKHLNNLLAGFQAAGSLSSFGPENCKELEDQLKPYLDKLCLWVIAGIGGPGSEIQKASHLVSYDPDQKNFSVHSVQDYIEELKKSKQGNFGTPFSWTYPSKQRGKRIQLKSAII